MYVDKLSGMVDATFYEKECRTNGARRRTAAGTNWTASERSQILPGRWRGISRSRPQH